MNNERKILYISVSINFLLGCMAGIVLFYGQVRHFQPFPEKGYTYTTVVSAGDFFRLCWLNLMWIFSVLLSRIILPARVFHPVVTVRGCVTSFSVLYILSCFGIREAVAAIIPQCVSVLPFLLLFSVLVATKQGQNTKNGKEPNNFKRTEIALIFLFSTVTAAVEVFIFRIFCVCLF